MENHRDPREVSLLTLVQKGGINPEEIRGHFARLAEIPFDSETKMMAVLVERSKKIILRVLLKQF